MEVPNLTSTKQSRRSRHRDGLCARANCCPLWQVEAIVHRRTIVGDSQAIHGICLEARMPIDSAIEFDKFCDRVLIPFNFSDLITQLHHCFPHANIIPALRVMSPQVDG